MAANQVFKVLTEFKFETGQAVLNAGRLQGATDKISQSADSALFSLKRLGLGLVADFGLGASSLLGVLSQALKSSENFRQNQLAVSNLLSSNLGNLTGDVDTFNDRLKVSRVILKDISKDALKFGLSESALASTTKLTAGFLLPKGLAGTNLDEARNLSRNFLKSSPTLGINPQDAEGQLLRAIEGSASQGDTLFRRLAAETSAFQDQLKGSTSAAKQFNALPLKERFELLKRGMAQFASDTDVLSAQAMTFGNLLQTLKDTFSGFSGVLLPLGDALAGPLKGFIKDIIGIVDTDIRIIFEQLAITIKGFNGDVKALAVDLMQLKELSNDFRKASFITALVGIGGILVSIASKFGLIGKVLKPVLFVAVGGLRGIFTIMRFVAPVAIRLFGFLVASIARVLPVLAILTGFFQLISRAKAIANVTDLELMPKIIGRIMTSFNRMKEALNVLFNPLFVLFDDLARFIAPIFSLSFYMGLLADAFETLEVIVIGALGGLVGIMHSVFQIVENLKDGKILSLLDGVSDAFASGADGFFAELDNATKNDDGSAVSAKNITNIGKVEINNEFKEKFEPDRIAFSLKEQLLKASQNPTAARGKGFALTGTGR